LELLKGLRNSRMETTNDWKPLGQNALEDVESLLGRGDLGQLVAHRGGARAPEIFERRMRSGEFVGMHAEQDFRSTGAKEGANGAERFGDVSYVEARSRPAHDHRADGTSVVIVVIVEQVQGVIGQPEDEVHSPGRNHVLASSSQRRIGVRGLVQSAPHHVLVDSR
jgi:hypothetical protein